MAASSRIPNPDRKLCVYLLIIEQISHTPSSVLGNFPNFRILHLRFWGKTFKFLTGLGAPSQEHTLRLIYMIILIFPKFSRIFKENFQKSKFSKLGLHLSSCPFKRFYNLMQIIRYALKY